MKTEYRMACSGEGRGHAKHNWAKKNMAKAVQSTVDANHHAEMHPNGFYNRACAPYVVETREVSNWQQPQDMAQVVIADDIAIEVTE